MPSDVTFSFFHISVFHSPNFWRKIFFSVFCISRLWVKLKPKFGRKSSKPKFGKAKEVKPKRRSTFALPPKKKKLTRKPSFGKKAKQLSGDIEDIVPKKKKPLFQKPKPSFQKPKRKFGRKPLGNVPENRSQTDLRKEMKNRKQRRREKYGRLLVLEIIQQEQKHRTKVRAFEERKAQEYIIYLYDQWRTNLLDSGDIIHVIPAPTTTAMEITREHGMIVMHPDILVSPSRITGSLKCMRSQIISTKHRYSEQSEALLKGSMSHELFERSLQRERFDEKMVISDVDVIIRQYVQDLYLVGMSENAARSHLSSFIPNMRSWFSTYHKSGIFDSCNQLDFPRHGGKLHVHVDKVLQTEQCFWSLKYGLMGFTDATLRVTYGKDPSNQRTQVMPFELKTGNDNSYSQTSAQGQVSLYRLMIEDYLESKVSAGILYFAKTNNISAVALRDVELVSLIQQRNNLAYYQKTDHDYPMLIKDDHGCQRCFQKNQCMIYHRTLENGTAETSGVPEIFKEAAGHLTKTHIQYLAKWTRLIDLEESESKGCRSEIWAMDSERREELRRCVGNLRLKTASEGIFVFERYGMNGERMNLPKGLKFKDGEWLTVSTEDGRYGLSKGVYVKPENGDTKTITLKMRSEINFELVGYDMLYRLDSDELLSNYQTARSNLVSLFLPEAADTKRRKLVVDLKAPSFGQLFQPNWVDPFKDEFDKLNDGQQQAVKKVLRARDYTLILGMPGTGKSTVIVFIVRILAHFGKRVLITSFTNTAVDNLCRKLSDKCKFLRVGKRDKIHKEVLEHSIDLDGMDSVDKLRKCIRTTYVFATTTSSAISNGLIISQRFDYCIVDEASQLTQPNALGPLRYCDTFVLVGDHYQLPPLVTSAQAREEGMDESLFKRLCCAHPQAKVKLDTQYRMNSDILLLCNHLVYNHELKCGSEAIANSSLDLKSNIPIKFEWLSHILDSNQRVVFLNIDQLPVVESKRNMNQMEINTYVLCIKTLQRAGLDVSDIGVMSPYNSQLTALRESIANDGVEVDSMDRFQGRDKDCILISFVHTKEESGKKKSIRLLNDWKRINVALTRAKKKLIMIGSYQFFQTLPMLRKLSNLLKKQEWIVDVNVI